MAKYGYARVSTKEQSLELQIQALEKAECLEIFTDVCSGGVHPKKRDGFKALLSKLQPGDTVAVYGLDRVSRDTVHVLVMIDDLATTGIQFVSITQGLDTTTAFGRAGLGMIAVFAQFERDMIRQRVMDGQQAKKRTGGRKPIVTTHVLDNIKEMKERGRTTHEIMLATNLSRTTVKRHVRQLKEQETARAHG